MGTITTNGRPRSSGSTSSSPSVRRWPEGWAFPGAKDQACDTLSLISEVLSNGRAGLIDLDINQKMTMLGAGAGDFQLSDHSIFYMAGNPREGQTLEECRDLLVAELNKLKSSISPTISCPPSSTT